MGSGIACHLAGVGLEVLMLDIVPFDLKEEEKSKPAARNRIVNTALDTAIKSKPAPLYDKAFASRITTGNFDDDMPKSLIAIGLSKSWLSVWILSNKYLRRLKNSVKRHFNIV